MAPGMLIDSLGPYSTKASALHRLIEFREGRIASDEWIQFTYRMIEENLHLEDGAPTEVIRELKERIGLV
ncbi:hypothetical protein ACFL2D_03255 [Patescibacteria group bacterium]